MRKGWCPSLHAPMASGDGLLVRLRPPRARLGSRAARRLAQAARACGNGVVELTQRASLQVRGLRAETLGAFTAAMLEAGLASGDGARDLRVVRAPLGEADDLVDAVETALARGRDRPAKFWVAVDSGGPLPLGELGADVRVACVAGEWLVSPAGADAAIGCASGDVASVVAALARACPGARMRVRVATAGAAALFDAAGLSADRLWRSAPARSALGSIGGRGFGLGLPFGACDLDALADLAERHGDGVLHLTPWRAVVLAGVADPDALRMEAAARGLITSPDDPLGRIVACPGAPACSSARRPTRAVARALAGLAMPGTIHVSGCAKGCAHPGPAALTLVGEESGWRILRPGSAA